MIDYLRMDPLLFCSSHPNLCADLLLFNTIQNETRALLQDMMDPLVLAHIAKVCYPILDRLPNPTYEKLRSLRNILVELISRGFDFKMSLSKIDSISVSTVRSLAVMLSVLYSDIKRNLPSLNNRQAIFSEMEDVDSGVYKMVKPILMLQRFSSKYLSKYLSYFILHGSMATLDYVKGWSDVDTFAVVKESIVLEPNRLLELRQVMFDTSVFYFMVDPFQHHGTMMCSEIDLRYYPQSYLPFDTLRRSKAIIKDDAGLHIVERDEGIETLNAFWKALQVIRKTYSEPDRYLSNFFNFKLFLAYLMTLPTYYLQAKGTHVYKKFSFDIVYKEFREKWLPIEISTLIRNNFQILSKRLINLPASHYFGFVNPLFTVLINYVFNKNIHNFAKVIFDDLVSKSQILAESMFTALKQAFKGNIQTELS